MDTNTTHWKRAILNPVILNRALCCTCCMTCKCTCGCVKSGGPSHHVRPDRILPQMLGAWYLHGQHAHPGSWILFPFWFVIGRHACIRPNEQVSHSRACMDGGPSNTLWWHEDYTAHQLNCGSCVKEVLCIQWTPTDNTCLSLWITGLQDHDH